MRHAGNGSIPTTSNAHLLLGYVADLELEVDRLRKQGQFMEHAVRSGLKKIQHLCGDGFSLAAQSLTQVQEVIADITAVLGDLHESPGYHPAHDQVVAVALKPLIEQVFRWQQRVEAAKNVELRLDLKTDHVEWFPARLRHILDNLISNSLRYRDPDKTDSWVQVAAQATPTSYEFRILDNGLGLPDSEEKKMFELFYRAAPARAAGLGVGLAVVRLLVEQAGGALTVDSGKGQGTSFVVSLPRYDVADYLNCDCRDQATAKAD